MQSEIGIIPLRYPHEQPHTQLLNVSTHAVVKQGLAKCGCLLREQPPARPGVIPYEPIPENRERLEKWIINTYASSAFNACEHQVLPRMTGEPLTIHFKENYAPKAIHTPIPTPHHWRAQVKADLDRDVALGIIEPVPQNTPTTWCSRMVIVAKKDGTPRRTVDFQNFVLTRSAILNPKPRVSYNTTNMSIYI